MNNKLKKTILFSSIFMFLVLGCKHQPSTTEPIDDFNYTIIRISGIKDGRQASPAIDDEIISKLKFSVSAKSGKNTVSGEESSAADSVFTRLTEDFEDDEFVYKIRLDPGDWTVTLTGKVDSETILEGTDTVIVSANGSYSKTIKVNFLSASNSYGNVDLKIDVTAVPAITKLKITEASPLNNSDGYIVEEINGKRIISIKPSAAVKAGTYYPQLSFCDETGLQLFSIPEVITVTQNMTTKYWFKSSRNPFLINPDANGISDFVITPELITETVNTIFYVNGNTTKSAANPYPGKETNSGNDFTSPLNNIQNAFKIININNNNDKSQGIQRTYILFIVEKAAATSLIADNPLNLEIYPIGEDKPTLSSAFSVGKNINLKIENFTISGAFRCDDEITVNAKKVDFSSTFTAGTNNGNANKVNITLDDCTITGLAYCYASSDNTEKCTITATNCTFEKTLKNYGIFTAESTDFNNNVECNEKSVFTASALAADRKNIAGTVTLNNESTATFTNINIGTEKTSSSSTSSSTSIPTSITQNDTSSAIYNNVEITKNMIAKTGTSVTFVGNTHFSGDINTSSAYTLTLNNGVVLKLKDVALGNEKLAAIKASTPSYNLPIIEPVQGQTLSAELLNRYELHKGIVKLSSIQIIEPTLGGCSISLDGNITVGGDGSNGIVNLAKGNDKQEITATVTDPDGNALIIESLKQYLGNTEISSSTGNPAEEKVILFERSRYEVYGLEIRFKYNEIEYGIMLTVKII